MHNDQFKSFFGILRRCLSRSVKHVFVLTLSGHAIKFEHIEDAIRFVGGHDQSQPMAEFVRYELNVRYSNDDEVRGVFKEKESAIEFLRKL